MSSGSSSRHISSATRCPRRGIWSACASWSESPHANGLGVQLTLFDWWGAYGDVEGSKQWARAVLEGYVGDPRIAFVELRNEIDTTDAAALAWTRELIPWLRDLLRRQTPVTVSVAGMTPVRDLRALVAALPARARPDFFDCAPLHRRRRAGREGLLDASRRRCADTAVDRRARLSDVDDPERSRGCPTDAFRPGSRTDALLQALLQSARPARAARAGDLDPRRLRTGRHPAIRPHRPGAGTSLRSLSRGRLGEAGGGRRAPTLRRQARDGVQRRLRSRCDRGGRAVGPCRSGARPASCVSFATRRWRDPAPRLLASSGARAEAGRSSSLPSRLRCRVGVRSCRRGFEAPTRRFASRSSGSIPTAVRLGSRWTSVRAGPRWRRAAVAARPPARAAFARIVLRAHGLQGSVWIDDVSFAWR